jgi:hypothetical protein
MTVTSKIHTIRGFVMKETEKPTPLKNELTLLRLLLFKFRVAGFLRYAFNFLKTNSNPLLSKLKRDVLARTYDAVLQILQFVL